MEVKEWNINLIEFICKFCEDNAKLKLRFQAYEDEAKDFVIKTLNIERGTYIPDSLRGRNVVKIDTIDSYLLIKLSGCMCDTELNRLKAKNYSFDIDELLPR